MVSKLVYTSHGADLSFPLLQAGRGNPADASHVRDISEVLLVRDLSARLHRCVWNVPR